MNKAIIFDMDGVIVDTEPLHHQAFYQLFDEIGIKVSSQFYDSLKGSSTKNAMQKIIDAFHINQWTKQELIEKKRANFFAIFEQKNAVTLIEGVEAFIKEQHQLGKTLVIASSASNKTIDAVLTTFNLHPYFSTYFSGEDFEFSKPHPAIYLKAFEATKVSASEVIVIEDATLGIKAAHDAGLYCVAYKSANTHNQDYSLANQIVEKFSEIQF